jgi:uncharacterized protein HemX
MSSQSSRFARVVAVAATVGALAIAGVAATGCGSDDNETADAVRSLQDELSTAQEQAKSVRSQAEEQARSIQEQAQSVQSEAEEQARSIQEQQNDDLRGGY